MNLFALFSISGDPEQGMDREQYRALFEEHFSGLRNFIYYKIGDTAVAEDIAQEAFIKLWEKRKDIRMETVKTFVFTIGNNLAINHLKHMQVRYNFANRSVPMATAHDAQFLIEEKEFKEKLEDVISHMPEGSREVFLMNRLEDLTYQDIADRLGISVKAIEKRMSKALKVLRDELGYKI